MKTDIKESIQFPPQVIDLLTSKLSSKFLKIGLPVAPSDVMMVVDLAQIIANDPKIVYQVASKLAPLAMPVIFPQYIQYRVTVDRIKRINQNSELSFKERAKNTLNLKKVFKDEFDSLISASKDAFAIYQKNMPDALALMWKFDRHLFLNPRFWISLTRVAATSGADVPADINLCMCIAGALKDVLKQQAQANKQNKDAQQTADETTDQIEQKTTQRLAAESLVINENTKITLTVRQLKRLVKESQSW